MPIDRIEPGLVNPNVVLERKALGDLDDRLPVGTEAIRTFGFHPPTFGTRKRQGKVKTRKDLAKKPPRAALHWLGEAIASLGGTVYAKEAEKLVALGSLTYGDVLFLVLRWQAESYPDGMPLGEAQCGICGAEMAGVRIDALTIPVDVVPAGFKGVPTVDVGLRRGFAIGDKVAMSVRLQPPSWTSILDLSDVSWANREIVRSRLFADAIVATDVGEGVSETALENLWPVDLRLIDEALNLITPTPDLEVEVECPACHGTNKTTIDWTDPAFFSLS